MGKIDRALMNIVVFEINNENIKMSLYTPDHLHLLPQESLADHFPDKNMMVKMNKIQYLFLWVNIGHIFPKDKYTHFFRHENIFNVTYQLCSSTCLPNLEVSHDTSVIRLEGVIEAHATFLIDRFYNLDLVIMMSYHAIVIMG